MKKKIVIATLFTLLCARVKATQIVRFATEATYAPFEFIGRDNKLHGFDIDLANALCSHMEVACTFTNQAFDSLIPSLRFRRFDAVISSIGITFARQKQVAFTQPYYSENSALFLIHKDKCTELTSLKGKRVGIQNGSNYHKYLIDKYSEITVIPYDTYQNSILDLKNGRLDSVFGDTAVINEWLAKDTTLVSFGEEITDKNYFGVGFGIAVHLENKALVDKLNQALVEIKKNGTYQNIYQKWFIKNN